MAVDDNIIRFPADEPPTASVDPYLESIAAHADAVNVCRDTLAPFKDDDRRVILSALMGSALCEAGRHPSRSLAIALIGPTVEMLLDYINKTYGERVVGI